MKTNVTEIKQKARELVKISKQKGLIKSYANAFKEFPAEEEIHKGDKGYYTTK